jgi:hypothetical protein
MRLSLHFIVLGLALTPMVAAAAPISWSRYQVPETGAAVDIPTSIFSEQLGKPEAGFGSLCNFGRTCRLNCPVGSK